MEEATNPTKDNLSLAPDNVKNLVNVKEVQPKITHKKYSPALLVLIGLSVSLVLGIVILIIRNRILSSQTPDLVIDAPSVINPSVTPSPTAETMKLVTQDILFESKPYRNTTAGFEINIPSGWKVDDSGNSGSIVVFVDPKVTMATSSALLTFINVSTGIASGETLDSYINTAKAGLKKNFDSYIIEEDKDLLVGGNRYHLIGGSYKINSVKMKNRNLLLVYNNRGYAISATSPESVWSKKELLINATLFSFKNI